VGVGVGLARGPPDEAVRTVFRRPAGVPPGRAPPGLGSPAMDDLDEQRLWGQRGANHCQGTSGQSHGAAFLKALQITNGESSRKRRKNP